MTTNQLLSDYEQLVARCWNDSDFKERLMTNPSSALADMGVIVPASTKVSVFENTPTDFHLVIPSKVSELGDEELEQVSGGFITSFINALTVSSTAADAGQPLGIQLGLALRDLAGK
jgi:hypothetical protein